MKEAENNNTLDPACSVDEPPFSKIILKNLDLMGIWLFALLTLMTVIANLVFVEEVCYIYHKIPSSKRSIFIWINAAAPVIATTSCIGMWIPRSTMFTDFTAAVKTLFLLKLGTFQFAFLRPVLMFLSIVLWTNGNYNLSDLSLSGAAIWINCFIGVLTIIALWPIGIMFQQVRVLLNCKKIIPKFALYEFVLVLSQLQAAIINILAMQGVIACAPPLSPSARGAYINQQLLIMEMFLITLTSRVVYRKRYDDLDLSLDPDQETKDLLGLNQGQLHETTTALLNFSVKEIKLKRRCREKTLSE
ncbi:organic solute transporter subunit alpha isoform X4 [Anolis carolinensis]|uniref:organic solute transporter subunit alpha isoform X4 n=1 Tax=Anolis carolinensis TaxID=28377 RepID=UPI002F2B2069